MTLGTRPLAEYQLWSLKGWNYINCFRATSDSQLFIPMLFLTLLLAFPSALPLQKHQRYFFHGYRGAMGCLPNATRMREPARPLAAMLGAWEEGLFGFLCSVSLVQQGCCLVPRMHKHESDFSLPRALATPRPGSMGTKKNLAWGEPGPAAPFARGQPDAGAPNQSCGACIRWPWMERIQPTNHTPILLMFMSKIMEVEAVF